MTKIDEAASVRRSPNPRIASPDAPLLVVLHGYGASEHDLLPLLPYLRYGGETVFLRAPLALAPGAWAWFPLGALTDIERPNQRGLTEATDAVLDWLDAHAPDQPVILAGFSQGGCVALQVLRRAPQRVFGVVVLSGFVAPADSPEIVADDARLAALDPRVPAFFGHGGADPVIPPAATSFTGAWLRAHTDLTERTYPGMGHAVDGAEIADVRSFLAQLQQ